MIGLNYNVLPLEEPLKFNLTSAILTLSSPLICLIVFSICFSSTCCISVTSTSNRNEESGLFDILKW